MGPSNRQVHQGMIAIIGRLVVLSVFMLVFGVTSTTAQTGQDERCADFTGQAHGLCTAAVSEGCFDAIESQACDDLMTNWYERCMVCKGTVPWEEEEAICPCAEETDSAVALNRIFAEQADEGEIVTHCIDDASLTRVERRVAADVPSLLVDAIDNGIRLACRYSLFEEGGNIVFARRIDITPEERAACQEDVRSLQAQLDCP
jgi:hypothetical protein